MFDSMYFVVYVEEYKASSSSPILLRRAAHLEPNSEIIKVPALSTEIDTKTY